MISPEKLFSDGQLHVSDSAVVDAAFTLRVLHEINFCTLNNEGWQQPVFSHLF